MKKKIILVAAIFLLYAVAKVYVINTPSPLDDPIPDIIKDKAMTYVDNS